MYIEDRPTLLDAKEYYKKVVPILSLDNERKVFDYLMHSFERQPLAYERTLEQDLKILQ